MLQRHCGETIYGIEKLTTFTSVKPHLNRKTSQVGISDSIESRVTFDIVMGVFQIDIRNIQLR